MAVDRFREPEPPRQRVREPQQRAFRGLRRLAARLGAVVYGWALYSGVVAYAGLSVGMTTHVPRVLLIAGVLAAEALGILGGLVALARVVRA